MKRMLLASFLFGLLGVGCMPEAHQVLSSEGSLRPAVRPAPVTPEQCTRENAYEVMQRLEVELQGPAGPELPESRDVK